jgi:hypothetical protein
MTIAREQLVGTWIHSHEEDRGVERVFRPPTFTFPRARGRRSIELAADGTAVDRGPGPVDRTVSVDGRWSLDGGELTLTIPSGAPQRFHVVSAAPDRLVLREREP